MVDYSRGDSPLACHGNDGPKRGAVVRRTQRGNALARYRDAVRDLISAGEPFGDVEQAIDGVVGLTMDQKAALWLFAFSLRDQDEQQRDARAHLAAVQ
jgi:hypothetical protein